MLVNECVACLRERVVASADLVDAAVIFGTGFAPFRGGPLTYARARGVAAVVARLKELAHATAHVFVPMRAGSLLRGGSKSVTGSRSGRKTLCYHQKCIALQQARVRSSSRQAFRKRWPKTRQRSVQLLRMFAPLDGMKRDNLAALAQESERAHAVAPAARCSARATPTSARVWLVSGAVEIDDGEHNLSVLRGGTPEARNPLAPAACRAA